MDSGEQLKTLTSPELIGPNDRFGLIPFVSASLMITPLIINHLQISKTLIGNGLETSSLRRSALFQYVKYLMQR